MKALTHFERKILIVDDEVNLLNMIFEILNDEGFRHVQTAQSLQEAKIVFQEFNPDLAILDVMLPDGSGYDLVKAFRQKSSIPIIFLTAKGDDNDRLKGLSLGADDYMVKPFLPKELTLRIEAILRRVYPLNTTIQLQHSAIDFEKGMVIKEEKSTPLTATEYKILQTLNEYAGRIVTLDALCEAVWGDDFGYENSLMAHIRRIREKTEQNPSKPESLLTARGLGYKLITRVTK
ncbi:DNA-binding response regulator [Bacillaceae bacterium SAS-127]|nr:DNA-binding response regulator [Bacillaceae bacterium SAS-127]